jgi:S-adenosylmethionine hydrolase
MPPLLTLTTDFGVRDPYVAAIKGVIFERCPGVTVVDLTHDIAPQSVLEGALFLAGAVPYFPKGTVHCAVVDPGVGTNRLAMAVSAGGHVFVCPDNGLLTIFLSSHTLDEAYTIDNPAYMRDAVSPTFHGRDIFAPAAAALARDVPLNALGRPVKELVQLDIPKATVTSDGCLVGEVIHIDRFGNCITNIHRSRLATKTATEVGVREHRFPGIAHTYRDVPPGAALALFGSSDHLEVAVNQSNAAKELGITPGDDVRVTIRP